MNIQPAVYNPVIPQGVTVRLRFRSVSPSVPATYTNGKWIDDATGLELDPSLVVANDLTGKEVRAAVRRRHSEPTPAISFTEASGNVFLDPLTGIYGIDFKPAATSALNSATAASHQKSPEFDYVVDEAGAVVLRASKWVYDIEIFDPVTGEVSRPINGLITLTAEVTR